jgi:hypothetical protein
VLKTIVPLQLPIPIKNAGRKWAAAGVAREWEGALMTYNWSFEPATVSPNLAVLLGKGPFSVTTIEMGRSIANCEAA